MVMCGILCLDLYFSFSLGISFPRATVLFSQLELPGKGMIKRFASALNSQLVEHVMGAQTEAAISITFTGFRPMDFWKELSSTQMTVF